MEMEEKYIKALSSLTGVRQSKLNEFKERGDVYTVLDRPNVINPTELQLEKIHLLNELKINLNISRDFRHKLQINFENSYEAGKYFKHLIGSRKDREFFFMGMFDNDNRLIKIKKISQGIINAAIVHPREILRNVLEEPKCKSVIFCHNHPSGVTDPSEEDIRLTNRLVNILEPLKIDVRDHIIVGDNIFSFQENGLVYDRNHELKVAENHLETNPLNNYYEKHLNKFINALTDLVGISKEKLFSFIDKKKEMTPNKSYHSHLILRLIEDPSMTASVLGLSRSQKDKLEDIKILIDSLNTYVKRDTSRIGEPAHIDAYTRTYLNKEEIQESNLYMMLFDSKVRVIGFEKLSYVEGDSLVYNTRDILVKAINYEALSVSLIMTGKERDARKLMETLQVSKNILDPLNINVLDGLYVDENKYFSLKEEKLMPNSVWGQPEYKKVVLFYNVEELEDEEEWEM